MNQKISKQLRAFAKEYGRDYTQLKRVFKSLALEKRTYFAEHLRKSLHEQETSQKTITNIQTT